MKILALMTLLAFGAAQAEQIDIYTTAGFGCLHQYHDADTSLAGVTVTIYLPQLSAGNGSVAISDDTGLYTGAYLGNGVPSVLTNPYTGLTVEITLTETSYRKLINSGRAHYWCTKWTLQGGTLVR